METRAPFMIVGSFVLAAIVAVFGFIYWLNNAGGIGKRETYHVVFNGPVLVMPPATHCLLTIEPPSPRRSIVWMIEDCEDEGRPGEEYT